MFIARWIVEARFGHKEEALALCKRWQDEVGDRVGLSLSKATARALTGSIGGCESRLEFDTPFNSLADLERSWTEMVKLPAHQKFAKELEQHIVSGSNRWEVLRVVEM